MSTSTESKPLVVALKPAGRPSLPWLLAAREPLIAIVLPLALMLVWHVATYGRSYSLIPPPWDVALALYDLAFGGINDDAYSATLWTHLLASVSRVYGGFALALLVALPLGLMIGRIPLVRQLFDPTLQALRPIPVTAW